MSLVDVIRAPSRSSAGALAVAALSVAVLSIDLADPASARVARNVPARLARELGTPAFREANRLPAEASRPTSTPPAVRRTPMPEAVTYVNVPLPAGAVQIDSTYYDLQDFGSLGTRIVATPDGKIHLVYEKDFCELDAGGCPPDPDPASARIFPHAMGYAYRNASGVWTRLGMVRDQTLAGCPQCATPDNHGGFGTLAVLPDGRAVVAQHKNEDGCDLRGDLYVENAVGGASFKAYLTPIADPLFPQIAALPNGSFTLLGEVVLGGTYEETASFQISRLASEGANFSCPTGWQFGPWTTVVPSPPFRDGHPGFPSIAVSSNGRCGIAVTDFGSLPPTRPGNVFLIESSNGTFAGGTVTIRTLTNYSDAAIVSSDSTSTEYRPYIHCHVAYKDTIPNVVWSELQVRRSGSNIVYADYRSRIRHWDSVHGVSTVKQVAPGEADSYDNIDNGYSGPISGFNTISVDWPQVGFSTDGLETYVAWLRFVDAEVDPTAVPSDLAGIATGTGYGDIAVSVRDDRNVIPGPGEVAGAASVVHPGPELHVGSWSAPQNLTQTPNTDERFFSIAARNAGGMIHVVFQASATNQAGCALIGDRGSMPGNVTRRIAYLERRLSASLVSVDDRALTPSFGLRAFPNPAPGSVRFMMRGSGGASTAIEVYGVDGRHVVTLSAVAGTVEWNGRDGSGRRAPSGLYVARVAGGSGGASIKFLLLH